MFKKYSKDGTKNPEVCKGCKYFQKRSETMATNNLCTYIDQTGHSRLKVEYDNGGYKTDSCVCYEKKQGNERRTRSKLYQ